MGPLDPHPSPDTMLLSALLALALHAHDAPQAPTSGEASGEGVHALADPAQPHGVLRFRVTDGNAKATPCRLTFLAPDGAAPELFPNTQAAPLELAVRRNVVYTLSGEGAITVPVGTYRVHATRGLEFGLNSKTLTFAEGEEVEWNAEVRREVQTSGWMGGDFHLHTLTHSGHGDCSLTERILSIAGEGLDAVVRCAPADPPAR